MAGQTVARREVIRLLGIASVAATFPGFRDWAFAGDAGTAGANAAATAGAYRPLFFGADDYRLIAHLAELIIPADETPGASQAGVAEFIDFMVANRVPVSGAGHSEPPRDCALRMGSELQAQWLDGIGWLNARCRADYGHPFLECDHARQLALLRALAYKDEYTSATEPGREFFRLLRDYTVTGYYTSRVGLEALGYQGLRNSWPTMPGCPHPDDPEHLHLKAVT
ncbi:MAG: gluconate 2-dehydrogenase subunit 3 family protein [Gammaproteobacteria bacterium]|nr:gluconate 2-dehydrogenase subunit 3 family protein [Gammaproteobacteria bacterium]